MAPAGTLLWKGRRGDAPRPETEAASKQGAEGARGVGERWMERGQQERGACRGTLRRKERGIEKK